MRNLMPWIILAACFAASYFSLWSDGWVNWSGKGYGIPLYRGFQDLAWVEKKGGMGYPIIWSIYYPSVVSLVVLCSARVEDAARLALANLLGVVALGILALSPDYIEPCTHDTVMVAAWIGGFAACERSRGMRVGLWLCCAGMILQVGEVWHGLGGSWCPLRESEKLGGKLWVVCAGQLCAVSVLSRVMERRLGISEGLWRLRAASLGMSVALCGALFYAIGLGKFWRFGGGELGLLFGLGLPWVAAVLSAGLGLFACAKWCWRKTAGR